MYANPSPQKSVQTPPASSFPLKGERTGTSSSHLPSICSECEAKENRFHVTYVFRPRLGEYVAANVKKGAHTLVEGSLISSSYERPNGKGKKAGSTKITSWSIRADVVRKLDRTEPDEVAPASDDSEHTAAESPALPGPFLLASPGFYW